MTTMEFIQQLLAHMGVDQVEVTVTETDEAETYTLAVDEQESGLLIGRHAETLDSLQRIVRMVCQKDDAKPIIVNINDFRERRTEHVQEMAQRVAERVLSTGTEQVLRLPANERRIVHMTLADHPELETVSEGVGQDRVLFVRLKATV